MTDAVTMYPKLDRREWIFTPPAEDPRDARIAQLEAAWSIAQNAGEGLLALCKEHEQRAIVYEARIAALALALSPEGDMTITQEELDA